MKVLQVINGLGTGGAERSLAELIPRAAEHGIDVEVVCLFRRDEGIAAELAEGMAKPTFLHGTTWGSRIREVRALMRRVDPDLVHTTIFDSDVIGRLGAVRLAPVLTSLVNTSYEPERLNDPNVRRSRLLAARTIDALTARLGTAHFHAITNAVKASAVRRLGIAPERITVIPRGRDRARLGDASPHRRAAARESLGIGPETKVILNVGRQEFQKGQIHLVHALPMLCTPDTMLVQAGRSGNATADLVTYIDELGLTDRVRLIGHHDDVPSLMCAADVFVFPSVYEGLGGAILEAMALDVPIVASDVPAIREVLVEGACGLLVPPADAKAIAAAIDETFASPDATLARAATAATRFSTHHDLDVITEAMIELYEQIVSGSTSRG